MTGAIAAYTVGDDGRLMLHSRATERLGLEAGDQVLVYHDGDELCLRRAPGKVLKRPDGEIVLEEDLVS